MLVRTMKPLLSVQLLVDCRMVEREVENQLILKWPVQFLSLQIHMYMDLLHDQSAFCDGVYFMIVCIL